MRGGGGGRLGGGASLTPLLQQFPLERADKIGGSREGAEG